MKDEPLAIFSFVSNFIKSIFDAMQAMLSTQTAQLGVLICTSGIVLYVIWHGYMTISGKINTPIIDLIWNLVRLVIILGFVNNAEGWLDLSIHAINGLREWASGDLPMEKTLDAMTNQFLDFVRNYWSTLTKNSGITDISGYIVALLTVPVIFLGFILLLIPIFCTIVVNNFILVFIIGTAPLFIACLSYSFIRGMFNSWLQLVFSNTLTLLFITFLMRGLIALFYQIRIPKAGEEISFLTGIGVAITFLVFGLLGAKLVGICVDMAKQLASASVESVGGGKAHSAVSDVAGRSAGAVAGGVKYAVTNPVGSAMTVARSMTNMASLAKSIGSRITGL